MGLRKISVLIVDDSLTIRAMVEQVLAREPEIEIVGLAASAEEAEQVVRARHVDVLTLDIAMPGMDGMAYLDDLMEHHPIPVVMLSSQTARHSDRWKEALRHGAVACFDKANVLSDAAGLVRTVLNAARAKPKRPSKRVRDQESRATA